MTITRVWNYELSYLFDVWCFVFATQRLRILTQPAINVKAGASGRVAYSMKLLSCLLLLGWRSFLSAFASIWRMRSLVTSNSWPTSSSV